jgi:hypothetical protein
MTAATNIALASALAVALTLAPARARASEVVPGAANAPAVPAKALDATELTDGEALRAAAALATHWGDFAAAEALYLRVRQAPRLTTTGQPESTPLRIGFYQGLKPNAGLRVRQAEHAVAMTALWVQQHPRKPLAHWLHVEALTNLGWAYRGDGYANTVAPQAWELFRGALNRATAHATQHADVLLSDSIGLRSVLVLGRGAGWEPRRLQAVYDQGAERFPDDDSLHFAQLTNLLPKWGGSARAVDQHIESVVKRTQATRGLALYAWLYTAAADEQFQHALFSDSLARWSRMDLGFADLTDRFPHPRHFNAWAWMACQAQDRNRLLEVLEKIGPEPDLGQWGTNARQAFDTCRAWAQKL